MSVAAALAPTGSPGSPAESRAQGTFVVNVGWACSTLVAGCSEFTEWWSHIQVFHWNGSNWDLIEDAENTGPSRWPNYNPLSGGGPHEVSWGYIHNDLYRVIVGGAMPDHECADGNAAGEVRASEIPYDNSQQYWIGGITYAAVGGVHYKTLPTTGTRYVDCDELGSGGAGGGGAGGGGSEGGQKSALAVAGKVARVKGGRAFLRLDCRGAGICRGSLELFAGVKGAKGKRAKRSKKQARSLVIGRAGFAIPASQAKTIRVRLTGRGKALLRRSGKHGLKVKLRGSGVGNRTVRLRKAPKR